MSVLDIKDSNRYAAICGGKMQETARSWRALSEVLRAIAKIPHPRGR
jgi:hypothetical protein